MSMQTAIRVLAAILAVLALSGVLGMGQLLSRFQQLGDEQLLVQRVAEEAHSLLVRLPISGPGLEDVGGPWRDQARRLGSLLSGAESEYSQRRGEVRDVALVHTRLLAAVEWAGAPAADLAPGNGATVTPGRRGPIGITAERVMSGQLVRLATEEMVLEIHDWRAAVAQDREHLLWKTLAWLGTLFTIALVAGGILMWLVSRKMLFPLEAMRGQIHQIEQGRLDSRIDAGGSWEVAQLGTRLNGMRDALLYSNRRLEGLNRNLQEEIRQRQLAETALRDNNRDLENRVTRRTEDLARYATLLERRNLDLRRFTRVASHDMRTPLRAIASFSGILREHLDARLDLQERDWFERVQRNTARLETLVDDLLSYSQFDSRDLQWMRLDMSQVLDESLNLLGESVETSGAQLSVPQALPVVEADRTAMVNVFMNLIGNALKFRRDAAPRIVIRGERRESEACFMIEDNGIGIAPAFREQVFEPFKRLHAQHEIPGTGLGLAICRRILERHGGHIWVEPSEHEGSRFCFVIPDRKPLHGG